MKLTGGDRDELERRRRNFRILQVMDRDIAEMRMAAVGYYPSFPVKYSNMYNDYSMVTAGLADPFLPQKKEKSDKCKFVVSYIGKNEPKFEMNNPHYMREVSRSHSDSIPPVILNKEPIQNKF